MLRKVGLSPTRGGLRLLEIYLDTELFKEDKKEPYFVCVKN